MSSKLNEIAERLHDGEEIDYVKIIEQHDEYASDGWVDVIIFRYRDKTYKTTVQCDSWEGLYPETLEVYEVTPVVKTVTVWERV